MADLFDVVRRTAECCLVKQGQPEVEALIRLVTPLLSRHWETITEQAELDLVAQLQALEDELGTPDVDALVVSDERRSRVLEDLLVAFLASLQEAVEAPFPTSVQAVVRRSVQDLLSSGARVLSLPLDFARAGDVRQLALRDLSMMVAGRYQLRTSEVRDHLQDFLTNRAARTAAGPAQRLVRVPAVAGPARDLAEWRARLRALLGAQTASWLPFVVDVWAYRWFNVGSFLAARQGGVLALEAFNNPPGGPDTRTTPFCFWVHGRLIPMGRAATVLRRYSDAVRRGDVTAAMQAWPLLPHGIAEGTPTDFRRGFATVGLPPYHARCRTIVRRAQL